jgi:hypothetical protein
MIRNEKIEWKLRFYLSLKGVRGKTTIIICIYPYKYNLQRSYGIINEEQKTQRTILFEKVYETE